LGALAGLRTSEIRGLRAGDVDFTARNGKGRLTVRQAITLGPDDERTGARRLFADTPKSNNERGIPLHSRLRAALLELGVDRMPATALIVSNPNGDAFGAATL
jgi:integrase